MKVYLLLILFVGLSFCLSSWETRHYELTDNGFLDAASPDSMIGILCGVRDNVGGIIYKTTDGGTNWQEFQPWTINECMFVFGMDFVNQDIGYLTGMGLIFNILPAAVLYKTIDGGNSWTNIYGLSLEFVGKMWDDVFFVDLNNGWLAGANSDIRRTTNGGSSWTTQSAPVSGSLKSIYFINSNEGWIVGGDYDTLTGQGINGLILHTTNGGTNWTVQVSNVPYEFWDVYFTDNLNGWVCGYKDTASPGIFYHTTNGGNNWIEVMAPSVTTGHYGLYAIKFTDAQTGFSVGGGNRLGWQGSYFGIFLNTTDGGSQWTVDTVIFDNDPWGVCPLGMDMFNSRWGYAGGARLSAFRYTPMGGQMIAENRIEIISADENQTIFSSQQEIVLDISQKEGYTKIEIYNILGRRILIKEINKAKSVSLPNLSPGHYFIRLYREQGEPLVKKIITL
ncbi:MAG: YCF48-related protein [candidate division WOR-3 bacterium]